MSPSLVLHHFNAARFDQAAELLAGLHPVDEPHVRGVFDACGGSGRPGSSFDAFWNHGARTLAAEIITGDRDSVRRLLASALLAIAGEASWSFPRGLAEPIHAIVGVDPPALKALYRLSGGPPKPRGSSEELATIFDARIEHGFDILAPTRFAPEPGEPGLVGAWSSEALAGLLPLIELVDTRDEVEAILAARETGWWKRLSGEPQRCAELRAGIEKAWPDWAQLVEALRATAATDGYLGVESRP